MGLQKIIKYFALTAISLYLTTLVVPGLTIKEGAKNIIIATVVLTLLNIFVKPIIKLLFLPVNLVTLGMFRWIINIIILYLFTLVTPEVSISGFALNTIPVIGGLLPHIFLNRFFATIIVSLVLSCSQNLLHWLIK